MRRFQPGLPIGLIKGKSKTAKFDLFETYYFLWPFFNVEANIYI